jgi:hypothetical protein
VAGCSSQVVGSLRVVVLEQERVQEREQEQEQGQEQGQHREQEEREK